MCRYTIILVLFVYFEKQKKKKKKKNLEKKKKMILCILSPPAFCGFVFEFCLFYSIKFCWCTKTTFKFKISKTLDVIQTHFFFFFFWSTCFRGVFFSSNFTMITNGTPYVSMVCRASYKSVVLMIASVTRLHFDHLLYRRIGVVHFV